MQSIRNVKLELVRPGPAHNQLLSPLTPYIALCGASGPVSVNLPFEHRQLLSRLERLRYSTASQEIPVEQRQFEARDIGESLGAVLGQVPSLMTEISRARGDDQELVHLRVSVSALELAMVPFELAIAPEGFPGSGSPLFLQSRLPITVTREVRRGQMLPVNWNRKPRILFAFAQPGNLAPVPAAEHLRALRRAIEPWVKWSATEDGLLEQVKKVLTVLPNATIEGIRDACQATEFTQVHILAHGAELGKGEHRFGLALCSAGNPAAWNIVDGETLAIAVTGIDRSRVTREPPTLVSLATCDSGQVGSVVSTGGSIAHELNGAGIPWVVASQFPLWMHASTIAVDVLYGGLLRGEDPRSVLYQLRKRLRTDSAATHDWASIVAYASVPWDFERQLRAFGNLYARTAIEMEFDHAQQLVAAGGAGSPEVKALYDSIRQRLERWCAEPASDGERSERLGMWAAMEKRIGLLSEPGGARAQYERARDFYRRALDANPVNHWVITQFLSMLAILAEPKDYGTLAHGFRNDWVAARQIASWELRGATGEKQAWALGTLAELELLGSVFAGGSFDPESSKAEIRRLCVRICEAVTDDAFPVFSTRRQFGRYLEHWRQDIWTDLAEVACEALPDERSWVGRPYVPPIRT
jgi:hypothetical protein